MSAKERVCSCPEGSFLSGTICALMVARLICPGHGKDTKLIKVHLDIVGYMHFKLKAVSGIRYNFTKSSCTSNYALSHERLNKGVQ